MYKKKAVKIGVKVAYKQQVQMWPTAQQTVSLSLTHTHAHWGSRECVYSPCLQCVLMQQRRFVSSSLAARTQNTLWNEIIWHTSLRAPCVAAPTEAWAEMLPADWPLGPLVSMGLIINCHRLRQVWGRPATVEQRASAGINAFLN